MPSCLFIVSIVVEVKKKEKSVRAMTRGLEGEEILYREKPNRFLYALRYPLVPILGLLILAFLVFLKEVLSAEMVRATLPPWGTLVIKVLLSPLWAAGFVMAFGFPLANLVESSRVAYTVTDRRIVIEKGLFRRRVFEVFVSRVAGVEARESLIVPGSGKVSILVSRGSPGSPFYMRKFPAEKFRGPVIYALHGVRDVSRMRIAIEEALLAPPEKREGGISHQTA
ncbi:MAG: PH domain-containing protein [Deltaproteobacteria bacterium]|nr:MAG: PH domain-containing protein [Deltaproteobacteria bacterium]